MLVFGHASAQENYSLLWEITGNGKKDTSYLFGSIHRNDKNLFNFPDTLYYALDKADFIVLETDIFGIQDSYSPFYFKDIKVEKDNNFYAKSPEGSKSQYGSEDGMPQFIDAYFEQYAYNANKKFIPLETIDFQKNLLNEIEITDLNPMRILRSSSEDLILKTYLEGDIEKLRELMRASIPTTSNYYNILIDKRNTNMASKLDSIFATGSTFCAVGAAHLGGPAGVVNLLRMKGYQVRKVVYSNQKETTLYKKSVAQKNNYLYENEDYHFLMTFGGKPNIDTLENENGLSFKYVEFGQGNIFELLVLTNKDKVIDQDLTALYFRKPIILSSDVVDGRLEIVGYENDYLKKYQKFKIIQTEDFTYILKASGGTKFTASSRAETYFKRFKLN